MTIRGGGLRYLVDKKKCPLLKLFAVEKYSIQLAAKTQSSAIKQSLTRL